MKNLSLDELSTFRPTSGMVLVKTARGNEEYRLPNGQKIFLDIQFEREAHAPVTGKVMGVPDYLHVGTHETPGMQWETDMELEVGDEVVYSYLAAMGALEPEEGRLLMCEGDVYFLIPYEECFVSKRQGYMIDVNTIPKGMKVQDFLFNLRVRGIEKILQENPGLDCKPFTPEIIPLNGYNLIEPVQEEHRSFLQQIESEKRNSSTYGRVAHVSSLIRRYADGDGIPDTDNINPGDLISFDIGADLLAEYPIHASLKGSNMFYRIQRRYINGILK